MRQSEKNSNEKWLSYLDEMLDERIFCEEVSAWNKSAISEMLFFSPLLRPVATVKRFAC